MDSVTAAGSSPFDGLGLALRWLRSRSGRHQFVVANQAGITKGMLSSYETGRQRPSLDTLEKVLGALGASLGDLYSAIELMNGRAVQGRPEATDSDETSVTLAEQVLALLADPAIAAGVNDLLARMDLLKGEAG